MNKYLIDMILWSLKNGQFWNIVEAVLQGIKAGYSWQESIDRQTGKYYDEQVKQAVDKFKQKDTIFSKDTKVEIDGYDKFLEATKGVK